MSVIKLNVLGKFEARLSSSEEITLPTRKSEALLTYLALYPGQGQSREHLAGVFWSDRGEEQSRNSLRQSINALRKNLGNLDPPSLSIEHNKVSVLPNSIELDALELEHLVNDESPQSIVRAAELCRGEFLEGLVIHDAVAEDWLAGEREKYRRISIVALENLQAHLAKSGNLNQACETGEKLVAVDLLNEAAWRQLMQAYAMKGERNHALKAYQRCSTLLQKELDIEPSQETKDLHAAIREGHIDASPGGQSAETDITVGQSPLQALGISAVTGKPSVVVVPFTSVGESSDDDYFADGLTEDIIANLSRYRELFVIDPYSAFEYRDGETDARKIAHDLGVEFLVKGNVRHSGGRIRISGQLIEAATGKTIWAERFDREFEDLFNLEDEVAEKIATSLVQLIEDESFVRARRKHPDNMTAFDYLIRAKQNVASHDRDKNTTARELLKQAVNIDPEFAAAYAHLAWSCNVEAESEWCESRQEILEKSVSYARKALELDKFDSTAHTNLGWACMLQKKYELAEVHMNLGIECNPNNYHTYCIKTYLLAVTGRASEVAVCGTTALNLNPLAPDDCLMAIVAAHYTETRYDAAIDILSRIREPNGNSEAWRAACLAQSGRENEARLAAANAHELGGDFIQHPDWFFQLPFKKLKDLEHLMDGLKKAGVLLD